MRARRGGFTLLEVMVSLAILALALSSLLASNARNVVLTHRAKSMTIAVQLLRSKWIDLVDEVAGSGFPEADDVRTGTFEDEGHPAFRYTFKITKVELPVNAEQLAAAAEGKEQDKPESLGGLDLSAAGLSGAGAMIAQSFELFRSGLEQSIRHVHMEVAWDEGTLVQKVDAQAYLTAPGKLDAVLPTFGGGAAPSGGAGGGSGGTGGGSRGAAGSGTRNTR